MSERSRRLVKLAKAVFDFNNDFEEGNPDEHDDDKRTEDSLDHESVYDVSEEFTDFHSENELQSSESNTSKSTSNLDQYKTVRIEKCNNQLPDDVTENSFAPEFLIYNKYIQNIIPSFQNKVYNVEENVYEIEQAMAQRNETMNSINIAESVVSESSMSLHQSTNGYKEKFDNQSPDHTCVPENDLTEQIVLFDEAIQNIEPSFQNKVSNAEEKGSEIKQAMSHGKENTLNVTSITESFTSNSVHQYTNGNIVNFNNEQSDHESGSDFTQDFTLCDKDVRNKETNFQNKVFNTGNNLSETEELNQDDENKKPPSKKDDIYKSPFLTENKYKITICKFCDSDIISKHFVRHLERHHNDENEVKEILSLAKGSLQRKNLLALLRNHGNLEPALRGQINPKKREFGREISEDDYAICIHCKGYFKRLCLSRHVKKCFANDGKNNPSKDSHPLSESVVYTACKKKYGKILNKLSVKKVIFSKMQADIVTKTAINDILIAHFGEDLLKKNKVKRSLYHISNKLRECGRFLLEIRKHGKYTDILSTLKPESFDDAIEATKNISRYHIETKTFGAASLALHFGTTLKKLADLATKIILRNRIPNFTLDIEKTLLALKRFRKLVDTQWTTELGSIALKNLNEKTAVKPQLLPLTEDIVNLKNFVEEKSSSAYEKLKTTKGLQDYKTLVETTLVSTILHNRKRVGDIQYLDLNSYMEQAVNEMNVNKQTELATSLSENEKILTQHYKRIVAIGKGSRAVTILLPKNLQKYFSMLYKIRVNTPAWFASQNSYLFTYPHSNRWIDGCSSIRKYAKICGAKNPELLTSSRLRKHIATVTQVLNLKGNEIDQLAKFMGHTTRTHEQFYKLPQDIYQVAKVSKILQLMEKGNAAQFKNLSLEEINIDMETLLEDEESLKKPIVATSTNNEHQETQSLEEIHMGNLIEDEDIPESFEKFIMETSINNKRQEETGNYSERNNKTDEYASDDTDSTLIVPDSESSESDSDRKETKIHRKKDRQNEVNSVKSDTECKPTSSTKSAMKTKSREKWSQHQKKLMQKYFRSFIEEHKSPRKLDCENFIDKHKSFTGVSWVRVKTYIYNVYRLQ